MRREVRQNYRVTSNDVNSINFVFQLIADRLDELEGRRGTPQFKSDVNMGNNRITSMGNAQEQADALSKDSSAIEVVGDTGLKIKILKIGIWDMNTNAQVIVPHGVISGNIRPPISILIKGDSDNVTIAGSAVDFFTWSNSGPASSIQGTYFHNDVNFVLTRATGGSFDNAAFSSVAENRGWIAFCYFS